METNTPAVKDPKEFQERLAAIKTGIQSKKESEAFALPKNEEETPTSEQLDEEDEKLENHTSSEIMEGFGFHEAHILTILALLVRDKEFYETYGRFMKPSYFATISPQAPHEIMEQIFIMSQEFFKDYPGEPMDRRILKLQIDEHFKKFKKDEKEKPNWYDLVDEIFDAENLDAVKTFYGKHMKKFLIVQESKLSFHKLFEDFKNPSIDPEVSLQSNLDRETELKNLSLESKEEEGGSTMIEILESRLEEPEYLVKPFMKPGEKGYLTAGYKIGKTFLAMQLTISLAKWISFLEFEIPKPRKVLYTRFELTDYAFSKRLQKTNMGSYKELIKSNPVIWLKKGFDITSKDEKDLQWFFRQVDKHEPDVAIFDPLYKLTSLNLADPKSASPLLRTYEKIQQKYPSLHLLFPHHMVKMGGKDRDSNSWDNSYGPMQFFADMDYQMRLRSISDHDDPVKRFRLDFLTNAELLDSMELERDPDTLIYKVVTETKLQKKERKDQTDIEKMKDVLKKNGKINKTTFMNGCKAVLNIGEDLFNRLSGLGEGNLWTITKVKNVIFYEAMDIPGSGCEEKETPHI
jgi:hypothetical protein